MKKIFFLVFLGFFTLTGCAGLQLENGSYSNRGMNATMIGAAIGAAPGIAASNKPVAIAGGLVGAAIGGWIGNRGNSEAYQDSREYRESARQEWKETYRQLAGATGGTGGGQGGSTPSVVVYIRDSNNYYGGYNNDWRSSILAQIEQGFRQRGFVVRPPLNNQNYSYNSGNERREPDADFRAEILVLDLQTSIKIVVTLRSLTGKNNLDRQGTGQVAYSDSNYGYYGRGGNRGSSIEERRERAAAIAAREAIKNVFLYNYEDTLS